MKSLQEIINNLFGGSVTLDEILSTIVAIYAFAVSIISPIKTKKTAIAIAEKNGAIAKVEAKNKEVKELKSGLAILSDIFVTVFLSSNTLDDSVKKKISSLTELLKQESGIELEKFAEYLLQKTQDKIPGSNLEEKKKFIEDKLEEVTKAKEQIEEETNKLIDNINL